jgi:hypothetical protein
MQSQMKKISGILKKEKDMVKNTGVGAIENKGEWISTLPCHFNVLLFVNGLNQGEQWSI